MAKKLTKLSKIEQIYRVIIKTRTTSIMKLVRQQHTIDPVRIIDISKKHEIAELREDAESSFRLAKRSMEKRYRNDEDNPRDIFASEKYVYPNQEETAAYVTHLILVEDKRLVAIIKRTKSGANGFIFDLWRRLATYMDDDKIIPYENIYILTGMSSTPWVNTMEKDCPQEAFSNIYHRNKMKQIVDEIKNKTHVVLIFDEIDVANAKDQTIYNTLKSAGILDIEFMEAHHISIVLISATIYRELKQMKEWGEKLARPVNLETTPEYVGLEDLVDRKIIKEFYPIKTLRDAIRWIKEDILDYFPDGDYRVNKIRTNAKGEGFIQKACDELGIYFYQDNSKTRLSPTEKMNLYSELIKTRHVVISIKGFERRAVFWPTEWKVKTGALHDKYCKNPCGNVVAQSFPGRFTGYWATEYKNHLCGIIRTSVKKIESYINFYNDPENFNESKMTRSRSTIVKAKYIKGLKERVRHEKTEKKFISIRGNNSFRVYQTLADHIKAREFMNYKSKTFKKNNHGFYTCKIAQISGHAKVQHIETAIKSIKANCGEQHKRDKSSWRTTYPCYIDITDNDTEVWVLLIQPDDECIVPQLDKLLPDHIGDWFE